MIYENKDRISSHFGVGLQKKSREHYIFNQSEQSCLEMLTLDFALMVVWRNVDTLHMNSIRLGLTAKG